MKGDKSPARRVTACGYQTQTEQRQQVKFRLRQSGDNSGDNSLT